LTWRRRILEALRLAPPSPETVLHRALRKCGARLVQLPSGAMYIETREGQRLKVESALPDLARKVQSAEAAEVRRHREVVRNLNGSGRV